MSSRPLVKCAHWSEDTITVILRVHNMKIGDLCYSSDESKNFDTYKIFMLIKVG